LLITEKIIGDFEQGDWLYTCFATVLYYSENSLCGFGAVPQKVAQH